MSYKVGMTILYFHQLAQAKAFYADTLGFPVVEAASTPEFVVLQTASDMALGLGNALPEMQSGSTELAFPVDDVDATWREWKAKGVTLVSEPTNLSFGRAFDAQDPEGHRLSVYRLRE